MIELVNIDIRNEMHSIQMPGIQMFVSISNRGKINSIKKVMKDLKIFLLEKHITSNTHKLEHKIKQNLIPSNNNVFLTTLNNKTNFT